MKLLKPNDRIWKYDLPIEDESVIQMPDGVQILCVQTDQKTNKPVIYASLNPENPLINVSFTVIGTGNPAGIAVLNGEMYKYVGTFQVMKGNFVGHVFSFIPLKHF